MLEGYDCVIFFGMYLNHGHHSIFGLSTKLQDKGKLLIILLLVAWVISSIVALYYFRLDFLR